MNIKIENVHSKKYKSIIKFYSKYIHNYYEWYNNKVIIIKKIMEKVAIDKTSNKIFSAYIGRIRNLLSNPSIKAVQSMNTLVPPYRGGIVLINLSLKFCEFLKKQTIFTIIFLMNTWITDYSKNSIFNFKLI